MKIGDLVSLAKETVTTFLAEEALTRGAAIAFYTATSIAPVLLVIIALASMFFGADAARGAVEEQLTSMMGREGAAAIQSAIVSASSFGSSAFALAIGLCTILLAASGIFGEMQAALNAIWHVKPAAGAVTRLIRARAVSVGLVAALGFLLIVSLAASAGITAFAGRLNSIMPFGHVVAAALNGVVSLALLTLMFAAIYKVLPDRDLSWREVALGASITALLFTVGKSLIGWYLGGAAVASSYGAAGGLLVFLLWVYYSAQIFLLGAVITKVAQPKNSICEFSEGTPS